MTWRFRFTVLTAITAVALLAWGAFVTSINAGLAVPDWPRSFHSLDPFNPFDRWWSVTPILAEHGHRLLGALVGLLTVGLAVWTSLREPRPWLRKLAVTALALVILQGVLGGLRVVFISLDLAVVHACVAQIFFSTLVSIALFTSNAWMATFAASPARVDHRMRVLSLATVGAVYVQIILGALLRHPGTGIDPLLVTLHIAGACLVVVMVVLSFVEARRLQRQNPLLTRAATVMFVLLVVQFTLGFTAYIVTLDDAGMLQPSTLQVVVNTTHMVVGALLMASSVCVALTVYRDELIVRSHIGADSKQHAMLG